MGPLDLLIHLLNFVAPALVLAPGVALLSHWFMGKRPPARAWYAQAAINFVATSLVLVAGLWFFGRDGKMATYAALVVACAASQWLGGRHWR